MGNLIAYLGMDDWQNHLYIKREDLIPYSFGGNKVRKAFLFFREIDAGKYNAVVTYGSSHSNHCRVIANMAAERKMPCYLIGPAEVSDITYNSRLMQSFGAEQILVPVEQVHATIDKKLLELKEKGKNPYFIPGGGHGNIGTQAYVDCYQEIKNYEKEFEVKFDFIFFASGTGTTQAGLVCGQLLGKGEEQIVGISIARKNPYGRNVILKSIEDYFEEKEIAIKNELIEKNTCFIDHYTGEGYAKDNRAIRGVIREVLIRYGIPLDCTYTGKAFYGMKKEIEKNKICGKNILFIHTGGTPLFFDDLKNADKCWDGKV